MVDKLSDDERSLAWVAFWNPSFVGIAILDKDYTFRSVNPQFCKLLDIHQSDVIGKKIQDVTAAEYQKLSEDNCRLMADGYMDFYILPKKYRFSHLASDIKVIELVNRVPSSDEGSFMFYVVRIMREEHKPDESMNQTGQSESGAFFLMPVVDFMMTYGKWLAGLGTIIGAILMALWQDNGAIE